MLSYTINEESGTQGHAYRLEVNGRVVSTFSSEAAALATARSLAHLDRTSGHADVLVTIQRGDGSVELLEAMTGDALSHETYPAAMRR